MDSVLNNFDAIELRLPSLEEPFLPFNKRMNDENENYATWIKDDDVYVPTPNLKIVKKLPSGMYKIAFIQNDWQVISTPLNTDELYSFSEDFTSKILEEVNKFWEKADVYNKYKLSHRRGILLCGSPGCGKTSIIALLVKQLLANNGLVFLISNAQDFYTTTEALQSVIRKIEKERPIIVIIEDIDQVISEMGGDHLLLDFLDGHNSIDNQLTILTSNDTSELSEALLRPSRIDLMYEIAPPDERIRKEFFIKKGVKKEDIDEFVEKTKDFSFAQLKEVFIGTYVLEKPLNKVISQIQTPFSCKDYLNKTQEMEGLI